jgi:membrane-associated phospholipid phosphatase
MQWNFVPAVAARRDPSTRRQPSWLLALRIVAPLVWIAATVWFVAFEGLPLTRDWIAAWIVLGLLAFSLGDLGGWFRGVVLDWLPFFGILALYDLLRGVADGLIFRPFFLPQIDVDKFLFFGTVPTVWLQERLYDPGTLPWYGVIAWVVYMSHFFATPLLAGVLWKLDRTRFRRYAACVATLSLMGFATYALFPAAPPWMASEAGLISHTVRVIPEIWGQLGIPARFGVVGTGYEYANDVAAVPSLHAAFSLLISLELWPGRAVAPGRRLGLRALLAAYPLTMAFALVYSGEHYVSDILLGWLYAAITVWAVRLAFARWAAARRGEDGAVTSGPFPATTD